MTDIFLFDGSIAATSGVNVRIRQPAFRKSTRPMAYAYEALAPLIEALPANFLVQNVERIGVVVGSSHGELDVTTQFLDSIAKTNTARPVLFQNSLHNSTVGFLTVQFGLIGPAMTVSNGFFSGEDAIDSAATLLRAQDCDLCFALGYDVFVEPLEQVRDKFYPHGLKRGEGAAALMMANERGIELIAEALMPVAKLIDCRSVEISAETDLTKVPQPFYDSQGIRELITALADRDSRRETLYKLHKPGGSYTDVEVEWL